MKGILWSIRKPHTDNIKSGKKTIEVRKGIPKDLTPETPNFIYETKANGGCGKVIGEFRCDNIEMVNAKCSDYGIDLFYHDCITKGCLREKEIDKYFNIPEDKDLREMKGNGYALHITDLKIYDTPKELSKFKRPCIFKKTEDTFCEPCDFKSCYVSLKRPPQSWCYVEEISEKTANTSL